MAFHGHIAAAVASAALALPGGRCRGALLQSLAELAPLPVHRPGEARVLSLPPGPAVSLAGAIAAATQMAGDLPEALHAPGVSEGLMLSLQEMLAETLMAEARLLLARRALQAEAVTPALVKSAALSHGFWHPGHVARDDRPQFGERPLDSRDRAASPALALRQHRGAFAQTG